MIMTGVRRIAAIAALCSLASVAHAQAAETTHVAPASVRELGLQLAAIGRLPETRAIQREASETFRESSLDSAKSYLAGHRKELSPFEKELLSITSLLDSPRYGAVTAKAAAGRGLTASQAALFKQLLKTLSRNPAIQHLKDEGLRLQQHPALLTARLRALLSGSTVAGSQPKYIGRTVALLSKRAAPNLFESLPPLIVGLLPQPALAAASSSSACATAGDRRLAKLHLAVDTAKQAIKTILLQAGRAILADSISLQLGIALGVGTAVTAAPVAAYTAAAAGVAVLAYAAYRTYRTFGRDLQAVRTPLCVPRQQPPASSHGESGSITLDPIDLPPATQYVPISEQLTARVEVQPKSWHLEDGATGPSPTPLVDEGEGHYSRPNFPLFYVTSEGLVWMLTGNVGTYSFAVEATEPSGQVVKQPYEISVQPAPCSSFPCAIWDKFQPIVPLLGEVPEPGELTYTFVWDGDPCRGCMGYWPLSIDTSETSEFADWIICFESEGGPGGEPQRCSVTYSFAGFGSSHRTSEVSIYFEEVGPPPHSGPVPIGSWTVAL